MSLYHSAMTCEARSHPSFMSVLMNGEFYIRWTPLVPSVDGMTAIAEGSVCVLGCRFLDYCKVP